MFKVEQRGEKLNVDFLNVRVESGELRREAFIATLNVLKLKPAICENVTRFSLPTSQIMSLRPAFFNPNTIFLVWRSFQSRRQFFHSVNGG